MSSDKKQSEKPSVLAVVALLSATDNLPRGQVGTVVEALDDENVLVEFSDDDGKAYAVVPCRLPELMVLHYDAAAAAE